MGLDMYLYAEISYWRRYDYKSVKPGEPVPSYPPNGLKAVTQTLCLPGVMMECESYEIKPRIGYWRKANAIHAWFIRDQEKDDCNPFAVSIEELQQLKGICEQILAKPSQILADQLLPTKSGFFFGPTDLNDEDTMQWYLDDLRDTIKIIDRAQTLQDWYDAFSSNDVNKPAWLSFEYRASW